jgi:hypothetical protein
LNAIVTVLLSLNFLIDTPVPQFEELVWRYWYICFIYSNKEMLQSLRGVENMKFFT